MFFSLHTDVMLIFFNLFRNFIGQVYAVAVAYGENHKKLPRFHTEDREFDTVERGKLYNTYLFLSFVIRDVARFLTQF